MTQPQDIVEDLVTRLAGWEDAIADAVLTGTGNLLEGVGV